MNSEIDSYREAFATGNAANEGKAVINLSQILNLPIFLSIILSFIILPVILVKFDNVLSPYYSWWHVALFYFIGLLIGAYYYLDVKLERYEIYPDHILCISGVLNRTTDNLEIYRIKDVSLYEPLHLRIFGLSKISIVSSDRTKPFLEIDGVRDSKPKLKAIRTLVEMERVRLGVREFD